MGVASGQNSHTIYLLLLAGLIETCGVRWPDDDRRSAFGARVSNDISSTAEAARWFAIPHGKEKVAPVDNFFACSPIRLFGGLVEREADDLLRLAQEVFIVLSGRAIREGRGVAGV
jgi:hypothetical protein